MANEAWYTSLLSSVASGLIGAAVVYYFGLKQRTKERRFSFLEKQLTEFYAPLAGLRKQIRIKSELRNKIQNSYSSDDPGIEATIEYHNQQFKKELLPKYREMLDLFTTKYHLAYPETRNLYPLFLEYVEIWNMHLAKAISGEVIGELEHGEEKIKPFYEHLEQKMQQLQDEIAQG